MNKPVVKILVCCHKPGEWLSDNVYMPIQCGKAISKYDLGIQGDDTGDNISAKNPYYCELTALYWAWKNLKDVEYIGLNHYRRRFKEPITAENIDCLMKGKDVMLVRPYIFPHAPIQLLHNLTCLEDVALFLDTILTLYPEYEESVISYYYTHNRFYPFHMFVMRRAEFEKYAEWLFSILFKVEERILPSGYSRLNRHLAYMGKFLWGLYCTHHKLKIRPMEFEGEGKDKRSILVRCLSRIRNNVVFSLLFHRHELPVPWGGVIGLRQDNILLYKIK